MSGDSEQRARTGLRAAIARHPIITVMLIVCTAGGAVLGALWATEEMELWRRIALGAIGGAGVAVVIATTRMLGAFGGEEE